MSVNFVDLNMVQLRKALQQAALPADCQIARLKGFPVADEVADDVGNWILWVLQRPDVNLTDEQRASLAELDALLGQMSGQHNTHVWTDEALRSLPEWEEVRSKASRSLTLFGWPHKDEDVPPDEQLMLRRSLILAALPPEHQIASFPRGSPVADWIAGEFFNWSGLALQRADFAISDEQRSAVNALDARLNEMSDRHEEDVELWTEEGLRHRDEWRNVRRDAQMLLELFHWTN